MIASVLSGTVFAAGVQEVEPEPASTIAEIAASDGRFNTLVAALDAADLVDTLNGEGPFTVLS
ncbi:MAG: fasciclin domain-containing protein, partial [bacterium]